MPSLYLLNVLHFLPSFDIPMSLPSACSINLLLLGNELTILRPEIGPMKRVPVYFGRFFVQLLLKLSDSLGNLL